MKKYLYQLIKILKDFVINPFWKSLPVLIILASSILINAALWYIYETRIKENSVPFLFASGLILLNLGLGNYLWNREKILSVYLLSIALFTQFLMLVFIKNFITLVF